MPDVVFIQLDSLVIEKACVGSEYTTEIGIRILLQPILKRRVCAMCCLNPRVKIISKVKQFSILVMVKIIDQMFAKIRDPQK